jgi:hypothetical protein
MGDSLWSMTLADVRVAFTEIVQLYLQGMRDRERMADHKLQAARLAQQALNDYLDSCASPRSKKKLRKRRKFWGTCGAICPTPSRTRGTGDGGGGHA